MFRYPVVPAAFLLLASCQPMAAPLTSGASVVVAEEAGWRRLASEEDEARLTGISRAWDEALDEARRAGFRRQVAGEGALLDPEAGQPRPAPSPGSYRCRLIRFGAAHARYTAYQPFFCHVGVDQNQLSITKQTGSERPSGYLWEDGEADHLIFLGSLALGNDEAPLAYGENPERDMIGLFERVGPLRFRLVIPHPRNGSTLEVFELVPAENQPEA